MTPKTLTIEKKVPVVGEYDVVVCGGGPAGFIAAVAAAREGAKTAIIEQYGFLGGMATAGYVTPLSVFTYSGELVIGGIPWEFVNRLEEMGGGYIEKPLGNIAFDPEVYKLCMQRMALEAGITLYMHSYLSGCVAKEGKIEQVIIEATAQIGEKISVRRFVRYEMGEGLQKKEENLADEVQAQVAAMKK